jgi:hypothetical protein
MIVNETKKFARIDRLHKSGSVDNVVAQNPEATSEAAFVL